MAICIENDGSYSLVGMTIEDVRSLVTLIKSGGLAEGRKWNGVKKQAERIVSC